MLSWLPYQSGCYSSPSSWTVFYVSAAISLQSEWEQGEMSNRCSYSCTIELLNNVKPWRMEKICNSQREGLSYSLNSSVSEPARGYSDLKEQKREVLSHLGTGQIQSVHCQGVVPSPMVIQASPYLMTRSGPWPLSDQHHHPINLQTHLKSSHELVMAVSTSIDVSVKVSFIKLLSSLVHNAAISNVVILQLIY